MTMGNLLAGLGGMLYELPKKAVSYAAASDLLGKYGDGCNSGGIEKAKGMIGERLRNVNPDTEKLSDEGLKQYATSGFFEPGSPSGYERAESITALRSYLENCGVNQESFTDVFGGQQTITEKTQKMIDYAIQYAHDHGKEIPFFGSPEADLTMVITGLAIGGSIALYKMATKKGGEGLFPNYSRM